MRQVHDVDMFYAGCQCQMDADVQYRMKKENLFFETKGGRGSAALLLTKLSHFLHTYLWAANNVSTFCEICAMV